MHATSIIIISWFFIPSSLLIAVVCHVDLRPAYSQLLLEALVIFFLRAAVFYYPFTRKAFRRMHDWEEQPVASTLFVFFETKEADLKEATCNSGLLREDDVVMECKMKLLCLERAHAHDLQKAERSATQQKRSPHQENVIDAARPGAGTSLVKGHRRLEALNFLRPLQVQLVQRSTDLLCFVGFRKRSASDDREGIDSLHTNGTQV